MTGGPHIEAAGVVVLTAGYRRAALDIARDFVREQSVGEWGDEAIEADAKRLAELLNAYAGAHDGPWIAPLQFGGAGCLCPKETEGWCRAIGCPRTNAESPP